MKIKYYFILNTITFPQDKLSFILYTISHMDESDGFIFIEGEGVRGWWLIGVYLYLCGG
jgi:hypothetical protein